MTVSNPILEAFGPYNVSNGDGFASNGPLWVFPGSGRPGINQGTGFKYMGIGGGGSGGTGANYRYTRRPQVIPARYAALGTRIDFFNATRGLGNILSGMKLRMTGPNGEMTVGIDRSNASGFIGLWYGATNSGNAERATSDFAVPFSSYNYYEFMYDYATHSVRWRVNRREQTPVNLPAVPIGQDYTSTSIDLQYGFNSANGQGFMNITDIFGYNDPTGAEFVGDRSIEYYRPTSDELPQDWTANGVANGYEALDNDPANAAQYIEAVAPGDQSQFGVAISSSGIFSVDAVAVQYTGRKTDAAAGDVQSSLVSNGVAEAGADVALPDTTYRQVYDPYPLNPDGGGGWLATDLTTLEILKERTA